MPAATAMSGMIVTVDSAASVEMDTTSGTTSAVSPVPTPPASVVTLGVSVTWPTGGLMALVVTLLTRGVVSPWTIVNSLG